MWSADLWLSGGGMASKGRSIIGKGIPMINRSTWTKILNFLILTFFIWVSVLIFRPVHAQQLTPSDDDVNGVARQLFCPICENIPLDVCPTDACRDWRELIRQMLAQGKSQGEIKQYFVDHYGARVLAAPPPNGFNVLVYLLPRLGLLIGGYLLFRTFQSWKKLPEEPEERAIPASDSSGEDYTSRFEEELRKRK